MKGMADSSANAIVTDPPYFKVKEEAWDRQWEKPHQFLEWMGRLCKEWRRILKPNGSLYVFASPRMAALVEVVISERFRVLNNAVWVKREGRHKGTKKAALRAYFPQTERIIFAEHYGADNMAKGESGYVAKCDELRGFVFEPLRAYLAEEWKRAGLTKKDAAAATGTQMAGHWFTRSQWALPTRALYERLRERANASGGDFLRREYDFLRREYDFLRREYDDLRREYDDLRREYDDLRRPFSVTASDPYTDVWEFPTVQAYKGKHPCEKPLALMEHIVKTSTRKGDTVLDCFAGSGSTGVAASRLGREFIGIELDQRWCDVAERRIASARVAAPAPVREFRPLPLFEEAALAMVAGRVMGDVGMIDTKGSAFR